MESMSEAHWEALPVLRMLDKTPWAKMKKFLERQALEAGCKILVDSGK